MKLYIHTDIEGAAGVTQWEHGNPAGRYYERSKRLLTLEINAAVEGALEAGATEIIVWDGHGPGGIDPELLHAEAKLLFGKGFPKGLGLDRSFDAMFIIAQHAMNRTPDANLCHSFSSIGTSRMTLNGKDIGEIGMRVLLAGYFGVPTIYATGDDKACAEASAIIPNIETVAVKVSTGRESAVCLSPIKSRALIRAGAIRAIQNMRAVKPYFFPGPYEFIVEPYDLARCHPDDRGFDRPTGKPTVQTSSDFLEISR
jgi:D-amino peptidase